MKTSSETELVLLCACSCPDDRQIKSISRLLKNDLDWDVVMGMAYLNNLIPVIAKNLHAFGMQQKVPDQVHRDFQRWQEEITTRNLILSKELLAVTSALTNNNIEVIPFKGPVLNAMIYKDLSLRSCGDIDLLVRGNDYDGAMEVLNNRGYVIDQHWPDAMQTSLWNAQRQVSIDLHWGIPPEKYTLDTAPLWESLQTIAILDGRIKTLSAEDTLLILCINATKEYCRPTVHQFRDIMELINGGAIQLWDMVFQRARIIGCRRMLLAALLVTTKLFETRIPGPVEEKLLKSPGSIRNVASELQAHLFLDRHESSLYDSRRLKYFRSEREYTQALDDDPVRRALDWIDWISRPTSRDRAVVNLPRSMSYLYYFVRPFRLLLEKLGGSRP